MILGLIFPQVQIYAQERQVLKGLVLQEETPVSDVHIKNQSSGEYTISNTNGSFEIAVKVNDTLWLSHVSTKALQKVIRQKNINSKFLTLRLDTQINELEEVEVHAQPKIDAVSLGILQHPIKELTFNEKRLKTASSGFFLFDPLINAITGRTKYLKQVVDNDKKIENIEKLREKYSPFLKKELKIDDTEIERLLIIAVERENIQKAISVHNDGEVKLYLLELWNEVKNE